MDMKESTIWHVSSRGHQQQDEDALKCCFNCCLEVPPAWTDTLFWIAGSFVYRVLELRHQRFAMGTHLTFSQ
jgi:hypothetical protein